MLRYICTRSKKCAKLLLSPVKSRLCARLLQFRIPWQLSPHTGCGNSISDWHMLLLAGTGVCTSLVTQLSTLDCFDGKTVCSVRLCAPMQSCVISVKQAQVLRFDTEASLLAFCCVMVL